MAKKTLEKESVDEEVFEIEKRDSAPRCFVDTNYIDEVFGPGGSFAKSIEGYEVREGQLEMARAVDYCISRGKHGMIDAPTATGKSYAYCVPAIIAAKRYGYRTVIVTENILLQEQLYKKDLPRLKQLLGLSFDYAILKGRSNYICKNNLFRLRYDDKKWAKRLQERGKKRVEYTQLKAAFDAIVKWSETSVSGDKADMQEEPDPILWEMVSCGSEDCKGEACPYFEDCFYSMRKAWAKEASIVVTNYDLYYRHVQVRRVFQSRGGQEVEVSILGPHDVLIFDEAHGAADKARNCWGLQVSEYLLKSVYKWMRSEDRAEEADALEAAAKEYFGMLRSRLDSLSQYGDTKIFQLTTPDWDKTGATEAMLDALTKASAVISELVSVYTHMKSAVKVKEGDNARKKVLKAFGAVMTCAKLEKKLMAYWIEGNKKSIKLMYKPADISEELRKTIYSGDWLVSVICTSATLRVGESFDFPMNELGTPVHKDQTVQLSVKSSFNLAEQARLIIPADCPDPKDAKKEHQEYVAKVFYDTAMAFGGKTMVLFTSIMDMKAVRRIVNERYTLPFKLIVQNEDMGREAMRNLFRDDVSSCLFGLASFWTGIDIPGEALSALIVAKLPFPNISDPLVKAIEKYIKSRGENPFHKFYIPKASIVLQQGIGRLLRRRTDYGLITLCDARLEKKPWGQLIKRVFNGIPYTTDINHLPLAQIYIDKKQKESRSTRSKQKDRSDELEVKAIPEPLRVVDLAQKPAPGMVATIPKLPPFNGPGLRNIDN